MGRHFLLEKMAGARWVPWIIFSLATTLSLLWSLFAYSTFYDSLDAELDPDGWGALGFSVWKYGQLSYYPDLRLTIQRAPMYPLFLGLWLFLSNGWWPYAIQIAQSFFFGLTSLLVYWIGRQILSLRNAFLAALICATHPFLIWYTSRVLVESLDIFLFTLFIATTLLLSQSPSYIRAILVGISLALLTLAKATFLPFVILLPLLLLCLKHPSVGWKKVAVILAAWIALQTPWVVRNWNITGHLMVGHGLGGYNMQRGDDFVAHFFEHPLSYESLWAISLNTNPVLTSFKEYEGSDLALHEIEKDQKGFEASWHHYRQDPFFFFKKLVLNAWMFWTLGAVPFKSAFFMAVLLPLLLLFLYRTVQILRKGGWTTIQGIHVTLVLLYFSFHLPIFAFARLSAVLVPVMIVYAFPMNLSFGKTENVRE